MNNNTNLLTKYGEDSMPVLENTKMNLKNFLDMVMDINRFEIHLFIKKNDEITYQETYTHKDEIPEVFLNLKVTDFNIRFVAWIWKRTPLQLVVYLEVK